MNFHNKTYQTLREQHNIPTANLRCVCAHVCACVCMCVHVRACAFSLKPSRESEVERWVPCGCSPFPRAVSCATALGTLGNCWIGPYFPGPSSPTFFENLRGSSQHLRSKLLSSLLSVPHLTLIKGHLYEGRFRLLTAVSPETGPVSDVH